MGRAPAFLRVGVLCLPLVFAIAAILVVVLAPGSNLPDDDFHIAAAQIIPVLLLAMVVEQRTTALWGGRRGRVYGGAIVAFLLVGELSAILQSSDILAQAELAAALTAAGLVGGFAAVALVAVVPGDWLGSEGETREYYGRGGIGERR